MISRVEIGPAQHITKDQHKKPGKSNKGPDLLESKNLIAHGPRKDLDIKVDKLTYNQKGDHNF